MSVISVIMPVYNGEPHLGAAVESILHQTYGEFELIALNDGSTDGSEHTLKKYAALDSRMRVIARPNKGLVATLNEGLSLAQGEYVARMDADDISMPTRFGDQLAYLAAHPGCIAVSSWVLLMDADGAPLTEVHGPTTHAEIDAANLDSQSGTCIVHGATLFRTEALRRIGGYRDGFDTAEDMDLFLRLAEIGELAVLPSVLYHYRLHINSIGNARRQEQHDATQRAISGAYARRGLGSAPAATEFTEPQSPSQCHQRWAWWALKSGHVATARKHGWKAFKLNPSSRACWRLLYCVMRGQ
jgi:glycosyltransferase involved in cell wall biosynthesis